MIISFGVENFRSIRERQELSMEAYGSQSKLGNTFLLGLPNGEEIRLVKTAGIYGANASGKSNIDLINSVSPFCFI
jgi:AAA15 family ATPase/GTPase